MIELARPEIDLFQNLNQCFPSTSGLCAEQQALLRVFSEELQKGRKGHLERVVACERRRRGAAQTVGRGVLAKFDLFEAFKLLQKFIYWEKYFLGLEQRALPVELSVLIASLDVMPKAVAGVF